MATEVIFTSSGPAAPAIARLIREATRTIDAALYRFSNPLLARALGDAVGRGLRVRVVLNSNDHYEENRAIQAALKGYGVALRLAHGRRGASSKMHHKFAVFDGRVTVTGSYNWTIESEENNYENLLVLRGAGEAERYGREFEKLWAADDPDDTGRG